MNEQGRFVNGMMDDPGRGIYRMADPFGCRVNRVRVMGSGLGFSIGAIGHGSAGKNDGQCDGEA
jgi:hypothetical protein